MAVQRKLGKPTAQRMALLRGQVTDLLWYGKIETTYARAKEVQRIAEKIITKAIKTYTDTYKKVETRKTAKGQDIKVEIVNDGPKKLAVRRAIMGMVYDKPEEYQAPAHRKDIQRICAQVRFESQGAGPGRRIHPRVKAGIPCGRQRGGGSYRACLSLSARLPRVFSRGGRKTARLAS